MWLTGLPPVWLDAYRARYSFLYRCERLRLAAVERRQLAAAVTPEMRRVAKVIRQSRGLHLRLDDTICTALDDLERLGYAAPDPRGSWYGWDLLPAGVLLAGAKEVS